MEGNTIICSPLRLGGELPTRTRATLIGVEAAITAGSMPPSYVPNSTEKLAFWTTLSEWSSQNLAALEGQQGAGAGATGPTG